MASICSAAAGFLLPMWTAHSRPLPVFVLAAWPVLPRRDVAASFVASPLLLQGLQGVPVTGTWGPSLAEPRGQCHQGASRQFVCPFQSPSLLLPDLSLGTLCQHHPMIGVQLPFSESLSPSLLPIPFIFFFFLFYFFFSLNTKSPKVGSMKTTTLRGSCHLLSFGGVVAILSVCSPLCGACSAFLALTWLRFRKLLKTGVKEN